MDKEVEGVWKKAVIALFNILFWNLRRGTGENHDKPQAEYPVLGPRFQSIGFRITEKQRRK
jgi:hypothetical protein